MDPLTELVAGLRAGRIAPRSDGRRNNGRHGVRHEPARYAEDLHRHPDHFTLKECSELTDYSVQYLRRCIATGELGTVGLHQWRRGWMARAAYLVHRMELMRFIGRRAALRGFKRVHRRGNDSFPMSNT